MRNAVTMFLCFLHQTAVAVWMGGILVLGAVSAPATFGAARAAGDTERGMPLWDFAGTVLASGFGRFNWVALIAGGLAFFSGIAYGRLAGLCGRRIAVRAVLTAVAIGIVKLLTFWLYPEMMSIRQSDPERFDSLHRLYSNGFSAQLVLLLGITALTAWLHLDRTPHAAKRET